MKRMILEQQHKPSFKPWKHEIVGVRHARCGEYYSFKSWSPTIRALSFGHPSRYISDTTSSLPTSIKNGVFVDASLDYIQSCVETSTAGGSTSRKRDSGLLRYGATIQGRSNQLSPSKTILILACRPEQAVDFFLFDTKGALPGGMATALITILNAIPTKNLLLRSIGPTDVEKIKQLLKTDLALMLLMAIVNLKLLRRWRTSLLWAGLKRTLWSARRWKRILRRLWCFYSWNVVLPSLNYAKTI